jgi:hypothetical protein
MNDKTSLPEVAFRPDFASRVLSEADAIVRRRRWQQGAAVATATVALVGLGLWDLQPSREDAPRIAAPVTQIASNIELPAADAAAQSDPLQWMFPDAEPVAQFADTYADAATGGADQRQQLLFADESDGARSR